MNLRERQNDFVATLAAFDSWSDRFNFLIDAGAPMAARCPAILLPYRIELCQSRSYFLAEAAGGLLHVNGWSNAAVMAGIIGSVMNIFGGITVADLSATEIDFHLASGLIDNLSPLRRDGLTEILNRIRFFDTEKPDAYNFRNH